MSSGIISDSDIQIITDIPLLQVPSDLAKPNDKLCNTCKALRLTPRDFVVLPKDDDESSTRYQPMESHRFGLVGDMKVKSSHCPLCRLVLQTLGPQVPDEEEGIPIEVTFRWSTDGPTDPHSRYDRIPTIRNIMPSLQKPGGGYVNYSSTMIFPRIGILANDAPIPSKLLCTRFIKDQIDFSMVRNWIKICTLRHGKECAGIHPDLERNSFGDIADEIPSLRMVDVINNCVTHAPRSCKYVALSYVRDQTESLAVLRLLRDNVAELEKPGSFAQSEHYDKIPLTIRDAMLVVKELGIQYLWVDSFCIVQDDDGQGGSKMQANAKMGLIYGTAALTIIAYTDGASTGLPGVHPGIKRSQPIEEIAPGFRLAFKLMYQYFMEKSVYKTMAWTFQEERFSRKKLIFGGGQVVYVCPMTDQCREDEVLEEQHAMSEAPARYYEGDDIGEVEGIFTEYTGRSLSNITDIYHAIAAFDTIFQRVINAKLCHGIPNVFFDWFLLWEPNALHRRRSGITPSWSWSGWDGESFSHIWDWYSRSITKIREAQKTRTWIVWYQCKAHDSEECVLVQSHEVPLEDSLSTYEQMKQRFPFADCSQTAPTPRKLINAPLYVEDTYNPNPGSGFLQFWTISVIFDLDEAPIDADTEDPEPWRRHGRSRVSLLGRDGRDLGTIMVNPEWVGKNIPGRHEFIVLCEGRTERAKRGSEDSDLGWKFMVMLIEWHGDGQWAERVAIGAIEKNGLTHALGDGPVWKEFILG